MSFKEKQKENVDRKTQSDNNPPPPSTHHHQNLDPEAHFTTVNFCFLHRSHPSFPSVNSIHVATTINQCLGYFYSLLLLI